MVTDWKEIEFMAKIELAEETCVDEKCDPPVRVIEIRPVAEEIPPRFPLAIWGLV